MIPQVGQRKTSLNVQIVDTGPASSFSVAPPLGVHTTSHTSKVTEPLAPLFNSIIHTKDSPNQAVLSISTENQPNVVISTAQQTNTPDMLASAYTEDSYDELETPMSDDPPLRTGRVRFRSRVRITSGLNRQRKKSRSEHDYMTFSSSSSLSGSPSSSISAPLRTQEEDEVGKPGWGTLGQRVSICAGQRTKPRERRERAPLVVKPRLSSNGHCRGVDERTPLTGQLSFGGDGDGDGVDHGAERDPDPSREVDMVFGPWPNRLLNHHWWWWHFEPIVCCHCLTESDDEG